MTKVHPRIGTAHVLRSDRRGATLVEYLVVVGVIALVAAGAARLFGASVDAKVRCEAYRVSTGRVHCPKQDEPKPEVLVRRTGD